MNVVLIGEEAAGMRTLQSLHQCGVRVVAVMASPRQQDGVEVACADEWILVRQVFREGICIPAREALKVGDRLADA
jgi:hypothetical protein